MSENAAFLSRILIFPIKSLDGVEVDRARVLASGALEHDRTFGLFDANGKFVNGKRHSAVHRLRSRLDLAAHTLTLRDENGRGLGSRTFALDRDRDRLERWLSDYFGFPVSFRQNTEQGFPDDMDSPGPTVISDATLAEIGGWFGLPADQTRARFRTNLEIGGVPTFWEDRLFASAGTLVRFRIGDAIFDGVNPCQRCVVPPRDPLTGANDETFVRRFTELRARTLPLWSTRERFNHFYRVAINTRPHGDQSGRVLCIGDRIEVVDVPGEVSTAGSKICGRSSDFWSGELVVDSVRNETPSVKTFRLRHPSGAKIPFHFLPGQFVTVTTGHGLEALQRCYTISSSPSQAEHCEITVKRDGSASALLHDRLGPGSRLTVTGPFGRFTFDGEAADEIVMIAGGVGITPLMSKIRFLATRKWSGRVDLLYSVKTERDIIFRQELAELQRECPTFNVHVTVTSEERDWRGARGRLTAEWLRAVVPDIAGRLVHLCGPTAMAASAQKILHQLGVSASRIEVEAFGGRVGRKEKDPTEHGIRFARSGLATIVSADVTILEAALSAGISVDHGCRAGVCGRCKVKLIGGEVAIDSDFVLTPEQKAAGMILACQAHPLSRVVVDC
jgi:ferredoxin-NADP reductase/uncharacterized protein YcbX